MTTKQLLHPQEVEVFYILPAIRKAFAIQLKEQGMKQTEIAHLLQIQDATVSQYLSNKRGSQVNFDKIIQRELQESAKHLTNSLDVVRESQRILKRMKETGAMCTVHKQFFNAPMGCEPAVMGCGIQ